MIGKLLHIKPSIIHTFKLFPALSAKWTGSCWGVTSVLWHCCEVFLKDLKVRSSWFCRSPCWVVKCQRVWSFCLDSELCTEPPSPPSRPCSSPRQERAPAPRTGLLLRGTAGTSRWGGRLAEWSLKHTGEDMLTCISTQSWGDYTAETFWRLLEKLPE